jgi:sodium/potassium-transporting ATPase subunit alpha
MAVTDFAVETTTSIVEGELTTTSLAPSVVQQLVAVGSLCNAGEFDTASAKDPLSERRIYGDATDQAVLRFSETQGSVTDIRKGWKKFFSLDFDSKNKFMVKAFTPVFPDDPKTSLSTAESNNFNAEDMYVHYFLWTR